MKQFVPKLLACQCSKHKAAEGWGVWGFIGGEVTRERERINAIHKPPQRVIMFSSVINNAFIDYTLSTFRTRYVSYRTRRLASLVEVRLLLDLSSHVCRRLKKGASPALAQQ